nr:immunoglobulin heavy chain junction region [Homo sapiens]MBB2032535.1 immunoglobulin heavy chain junction region [Homo sapiens]
CARVSLGYL